MIIGNAVTMSHDTVTAGTILNHIKNKNHFL